MSPAKSLPDLFEDYWEEVSHPVKPDPAGMPPETGATLWVQLLYNGRKVLPDRLKVRVPFADNSGIHVIQIPTPPHHSLTLNCIAFYLSATGPQRIADTGQGQEYHISSEPGERVSLSVRIPENDIFKLLLGLPL